MPGPGDVDLRHHLDAGSDLTPNINLILFTQKCRLESIQKFYRDTNKKHDMYIFLHHHHCFPPYTLSREFFTPSRLFFSLTPHIISPSLSPRALHPGKGVGRGMLCFKYREVPVVGVSCHSLSMGFLTFINSLISPFHDCYGFVLELKNVSFKPHNTKLNYVYSLTSG